MAEENLDLEEEVKHLRQEVERLQAVHEIQNLVGHYALIHTPMTEWTSPQLFALKQPDVSCEIAMWGVAVGPEKVRKFYPEAARSMPGAMFEHQFTTPVIQVAADGQTAKGIWFSPGHETPVGEDGKPQAKWCWGKYSGDFIKEDGRWKIWHWHFWDTFMCPFDKSWVDTPQPPLDAKVHDGADKPPTYRSSYFPDRVRESIPAYPEPYDTWDGKSVA